MAIQPYEDWLGIPSSTQSPNHYELLGVATFENDVQHLNAAYEHRYAQVRMYEVGNYADEATRLMREITTAYNCLRDPREKQAYDEQLQNAINRATISESPADSDTVSDIHALPADAAAGLPASHPWHDPLSAPSPMLQALVTDGGKTTERRERSADAATVALQVDRRLLIGGGAALAAIAVVVLVGMGVLLASVLWEAPRDTASVPDGGSSGAELSGDREPDREVAADEQAETEDSDAGALGPVPVTPGTLVEWSGELMKVVTLPEVPGGGVWLLVAQPDGKIFHAYAAEIEFAREIADMSAAAETGAKGAAIDVLGRVPQGRPLTRPFGDDADLIEIISVRSPQGLATVGSRRSRFTLPADQRDIIEGLRTLNREVGFDAQLEHASASSDEAIASVLGCRYLVKIPEAWHPLSARAVNDLPVSLVAASSGEFVSRDGRELPVLHGIKIGPPTDTIAASTPEPSSKVSVEPRPLRGPEPAPSSRSPARNAPAGTPMMLGDTVDLPPEQDLDVQILGQLGWPAGENLRLGLDASLADPGADLQFALQQLGPDSWIVWRASVTTEANKQRVAGFAVQDNALKFVWLDGNAGAQLRNCRLQVADKSRQQVVTLREASVSGPVGLPQKDDERRLELEVANVPDKAKLVLEAVVEFQGVAVDPTATGQQLGFGRSRKFTYKDVSALGNLAEFVCTELRLGSTDDSLNLSIEPRFEHHFYNHELTDEGLQEAVKAVERSFINAVNNERDATRRFNEVSSRGGNPKVKAAALLSQRKRIATALEDQKRANDYKRYTLPLLGDLRQTLRRNVQVRFRISAMSETATIVLYDAGYKEFEKDHLAGH